jgi:two-component system cell cycle sensor histidine kinase PleC
MNEYALLLGDAVLRNRARVAEQSARIESELAGKVKSEFIANMSHELRTPLNTVIGFSKLLSEHERRNLPTNEIVEYATLINDAAGHLLSVINDILDISKIQSGRYTLDTREVSIEEILVACINSFRSMAEQAGVTFATSIAYDLPVARGDVVKLRQVFTNVMSNAVKFTQHGGSVKIEALRTSTGGVSVLVRDTGVGMTKEEIAVAMTPFGQVDAGRTRWREGAGLGLPIAKALIELHGGQIELRSTKGVGTDVMITLPDRNSVSAVHKDDLSPLRSALV